MHSALLSRAMQTKGVCELRHQTASRHFIDTSGIYDQIGNAVHDERREVGILDMIARSMNFTYYYGQDEKFSGSSGSQQLPNGSLYMDWPDW